MFCTTSNTAIVSFSDLPFESPDNTRFVLSLTGSAAIEYEFPAWTTPSGDIE